MRSCCIEGCRSRSTDIDRNLFEYCIGFWYVFSIYSDNTITSSLFRINDGRTAWLTLIREHQPINKIGRTLYICDLHFNANDIKKSSKKTVLNKNAVPNIGYDLLFQPIYDPHFQTYSF